MHRRDPNYLDDYGRRNSPPPVKTWQGHWAPHACDVSNDTDDFETYDYEYKSQAYLRSPPHSRGDEVRVRRPSPADVSAAAYPSPRIDVRRGEDKRCGTRRYTRAEPSYTRSMHPEDLAYLNKAASKIQASFRGYSARKKYWKEREKVLRQQSRDMSGVYRQEESLLPSVTSIVDDVSVSVLATNADPNIGLTSPLPVLESSQKNYILRELKGKLNFSDEISTASQLQNEGSQTIVLLGGLDPANAKDYVFSGCMFLYNVQKDKWYFGGTMPEPRNYHGAAHLRGKIYVIGGFSPMQIFRRQMVSTQTTYQLNVRSKRWRRRADMHQARANHATCVVHDDIMVMGGVDASGKLLSTVEMYNPERDQWMLSKQMPEALMGMGCALMDDLVWVVGGICNEGHGSRYGVSNRVYAFDIQSQSWYRKPSLPEPRAFCSAATIMRELWVWCGVKETLNEDGYLTSSNTVFVFNNEAGKWEQHHAIGTAKHAMAIAKIGRRAFLFGGMTSTASGRDVLNEMDFYDRENDKLMEGAPLPRPITGAAAVSIPIDYAANTDMRWSQNKVRKDTMDEAATKIQAAYRGYRTRSRLEQHLSSEKFKKSSMVKYSYAVPGSRGESFDDKWRLFAPVNIPDWPPVPDIRSSSSHLNLALGTQPAGYTLTPVNSGIRVRRYVPLPSHSDPNLALCGHLCNVYKKTKKVLGLRRVEHMPSFAKSMRTVTQLQDDSVPVVLVTGGLQPRDPVNYSYGKLLMRYHTLKDRWEYFGVLPQPRNYHAAIYHQEFVYLTGGCDPDLRNSGEMVPTSTTFCLNIHSSDWVQKADMNCARSHHCLVEHGNRIYAVGGRDHNGRLVASVEAYDADKDEWTLMNPMGAPRMGMACAVMDNHIWVMGGIGASEEDDTSTYTVLASVVSYDIVNNKWLNRPPLRCPRAFGTCVVVDESLWLCGGASKDRNNNYLISMGSVDKYYPTEAQWIRRTVLSNPRHSAAVVAVESCVYMFGGMSSQEWSALCRNEMIVVDDVSLHTTCDLPVPLTGCAAVAIPPVMPSLRATSLALLLHENLMK